MKSNTLTYTPAELAAVGGTSKDARLVVSKDQYGHPQYNDPPNFWPALVTNSDYTYPRHMKIFNGTGLDVEFVVLSNQDEIDAYTASPSTYTGWIKLSNGLEYEFHRIGKVYYLVFKTVTGVAPANNLRVDCWGFFQV